MRTERCQHRSQRAPLHQTRGDSRPLNPIAMLKGTLFTIGVGSYIQLPPNGPLSCSVLMVILWWEFVALV